MSVIWGQSTISSFRKEIGQDDYQWNNYYLKEILALSSGKPCPKNKSDSPTETNRVPVFGSNGIYGYVQDHLVDYPTICIGRVGASGVINRTPNITWITDNALFVEKIREDIVHLPYLYYLLNYIDLSKYQKKSGQPLVTQTDILSIRISLPSLNDQRQVATVLATVDEAIAATGRVIEITVELKKELLNCVFKPEFWRVRSTIHAIYQDSWRLIKIDDIKAEKRNAISLGPFGSDLTSEFYKNFGVPVLRGKNLSKMKVNFENLVYVSESKADELRSSNVFPNDIIITYRGTLGQVSLLQNPLPWHRCVISQSLMKISCNERIVNPEYILQYLKSPAGQKKILSYKGHTGVPALGNPITSIKQLQVPLPSLPQQDYIVEILSTVDDGLATERAERDRLITLKKGLMQVLLTGRVRVPPGVAEEVAPAHV